jgi:ribosomal protein S18 acetylase RimI-like enzyme
MITSCLREKRLAGYVLVHNRQIKGYSYFFYEGEKALIGNLFVQPNSVGLDQAQRLLDHVLETLLETPGVCRVETQLPHFSFEDLEPCFRARSFQGYLRRFMAVSLANRAPRAEAFSLSEPPQVGQGPRGANDFLIEPWGRTHDLAAAQLLYRAYQQHLDAIINDQYACLAGTTRLIENIAHHRGCGQYLPRASLVAIHRPTGKLAGLLALTAVRAQTAHIPQVAVAREFQGLGLGTALVETSFKALAQEGYQEVSLTVTDVNAEAVRLYERLGFETFRTFGAFVWDRVPR